VSTSYKKWPRFGFEGLFPDVLNTNLTAILRSTSIFGSRKHEKLLSLNLTHLADEEEEEEEEVVDDVV
jgi:hypothetical protein